MAPMAVVAQQDVTGSGSAAGRGGTAHGGTAHGGTAHGDTGPAVTGRGAAGRLAPGRRMAKKTQFWLIAGAVIFAVATTQMFGRRYNFFDMKIYHGAMEWWTNGGELYDFIATGTTLGYTYPPFGALAMVPIAGMPAIAAGWVNTVLSVAALGVILAVLLVPIADRCGWPRWLTVTVALPLALAMEPNRETLGFGQVNLLLFLLVVADLVALRWAAQRFPALRNPALRNPAQRGQAPRGPGRPGPAPRDSEPAVSRTATAALRACWLSGAWAGVGIGLATAIKLTPGLFILYFLVSRQWRPAAVASLTAAGATVLAWLAAPRESVTYFTSLVWQTDRVGAADFAPNQALSGLLARLYDQPDRPGMLWLSFAALCLALGLSRAVAAHKEGDELASFTLVGITAAVISPISWTHHLVFILPAVVILADAALRRRAASRGLGLAPSLAGLRYGSAALGVYVLFLVTPVWWVRHRLDEGGSHYDSGLWGVLAENSLILGLILVLALMPWRPGAEPAFPAPRAHRLTRLARTAGTAGTAAWVDHEPRG